MNQWTLKIILPVFLAAFFISTPGFADENEVVALRNEVKDLNNKIAALERQMRSVESHVPVATPASYVGPSTEQGNGVLKTFQDIHLGGYIDTQYNQNLSKTTTNLGGNPLRSFDNNQNTFSVNSIELNFQKTPNPEGGAGFDVDLGLGRNAIVVDGTTPSAGAANGVSPDDIAIYQGYAELVAPLHSLDGNSIFGNTVNIKMGRYVTLAGAEVIKSPDNWNISHSYMFGLAIPFTHTGLRATYNLFKNKLTTFWGLNNGWDNPIDNNNWKTLESGFTFNPLEKLSWSSCFYYGPENTRQGGHRRFLMTHVATWHATDKLSLMGEIDLGTERRVVGLEGFGFHNANWEGYAGYARYQLTDKLATAYRIEFFRDGETYRTGTSLGPDQDNLWEQTLTAEYKIYDNLIGRVEYRFDKSNDRNDFNAKSHQQTLGAQLIYNFA